jgi:hypothetical protein
MACFAQVAVLRQGRRRGSGGTDADSDRDSALPQTRSLRIGLGRCSTVQARSATSRSQLVIAFIINPTWIKERKEGSYLLQSACWQLSLQLCGPARRRGPAVGPGALPLAQLTGGWAGQLASQLAGHLCRYVHVCACIYLLVSCQYLHISAGIMSVQV